MVLYMDYTTNIPDACIDHLRVQMEDGSEHILDWDEYEAGFDLKNPQCWSMRAKGVLIEIGREFEYADGHEAELEGAVIVDGSWWMEGEESWDFPEEPTFRLDGAVLLAHDDTRIELKAGPIELLRKNQASRME